MNLKITLNNKRKQVEEEEGNWMLKRSEIANN